MQPLLGLPLQSASLHLRGGNWGGDSGSNVQRDEERKRKERRGEEREKRQGGKGSGREGKERRREEGKSRGKRMKGGERRKKKRREKEGREEGRRGEISEEGLDLKTNNSFHQTKPARSIRMALSLTLEAVPISLSDIRRTCLPASETRPELPGGWCKVLRTQVAIPAAS